MRSIFFFLLKYFCKKKKKVSVKIVTITDLMKKWYKKVSSKYVYTIIA